MLDCSNIPLFQTSGRQVVLTDRVACRPAVLGHFLLEPEPAVWLWKNWPVLESDLYHGILAIKTLQATMIALTSSMPGSHEFLLPNRLGVDRDF